MSRLCTNDLSSKRECEDPVEWDAWLVPEALQDNESLGDSSCISNILGGKDHAPRKPTSWGFGSLPEGSPFVPFSVLAQCKSSIL
jgi:hypothetical protein